MTANAADTAPVQGATGTIISDIRKASQSANVDFSYMVATAAQESDFNPSARASTTNATGLYQFLDSTWLSMFKEFGAKYGQAGLASQITVNENGHASVSDPATRQQILNLRNDPSLSADLAAELAKRNKSELERGLGRSASPTDLYLAHFLGASGATSFVKTIQADGAAKAADLLPAAAASNPSVFYNANGQAKSVSEIYQSFAAKIEKQITRFAAAAGVNTDTAAEAVAANGVGDFTAQAKMPFLATLNALTVTALKLLGRHERPPGTAAGTETADPSIDTSA